jgi:hypothetical protein
VETHRRSRFGANPQARFIHFYVSIAKETHNHHLLGAGSVLQQVVANGGKTKPQLFRGAITSSTFLPSQYNYNDRVPEVRRIWKLYFALADAAVAALQRGRRASQVSSSTANVGESLLTSDEAAPPPGIHSGV